MMTTSLRNFIVSAVFIFSYESFVDFTTKWSLSYYRIRTDVSLSHVQVLNGRMRTNDMAFSR